MFKKFFWSLFSLWCVVGVEGSELFKTTYTFANVSVNYLDWRSSEKATSFPYFEFEGGSGHEWGETYIFFDIQNPTKSYNDEKKHLAFALKPTLDLKITGTWAFHVQDYILESKPFRTNDAVAGISYKFTTDVGVWARPFMGFHYKSSSYYTGSDGLMFGWLFNYSYKDLRFFQWHEMTFLRDREDGYGDRVGVQGALSLWYKTPYKLRPGIQYRYTYYELGMKSYEWAWIYTLKYDF